MNININTQVSVILTDAGLKCHNNYYLDLFQYAPSQAEIYLKDENNRIYSGELWGLMQVFGRDIYMGMPQIFFENNDIEFLDI